VFDIENSASRYSAVVVAVRELAEFGFRLVLDVPSCRVLNRCKMSERSARHKATYVFKHRTFLPASSTFISISRLLFTLSRCLIFRGSSLPLATCLTARPTMRERMRTVINKIYAEKEQALREHREDDYGETVSGNVFEQVIDSATHASPNPAFITVMKDIAQKNLPATNLSYFGTAAGPGPVLSIRVHWSIDTVHPQPQLPDAHDAAHKDEQCVLF
jgi:hypothetical protein